MSTAPNRPFEGVQRIVLHGGRWEWAQQLVLSFDNKAQPLQFLERLQKQQLWPAAAGESSPFVQVSLGFSRHGLERAYVPRHVLAFLALKSPAFHAGAALRASRYLGATGRDAPEVWDEAFGLNRLDAVMSLHAMQQQVLLDNVEAVRRIAGDTGIGVTRLAPARRLQQDPDGKPAKDGEQWMHFGYRDGLTRVGIQGWTTEQEPDLCEQPPAHAAGEFVLGMPQDSGANPWIGGPGTRVWPDALRSFFHNGSFGVLHQIEQEVVAFEQFVAEKAKQTGLRATEIKAKVCGRYPDGRPVGHPKVEATAEFDYADDPEGHGCPFGSHARRMNPRGDNLAHGERSRALLRRGMPYTLPNADGKPGLMGQFFCASIEDQYEHLLGQWADRVPMGSGDRGGARDPLIGAHAPGDGAFEIPRKDQPSLMLQGLRPFTTTLGVAYLFYPSLSTLKGIAESSLWIDPDEDDA